MCCHASILHVSNTLVGSHSGDAVYGSVEALIVAAVTEGIFQCEFIRCHFVAWRQWAGSPLGLVGAGAFIPTLASRAYTRFELPN